MRSSGIIKFCLTLSILFLVSRSAYTETELKEAKGFTLNDTSGRQVNLNDILGKKIILLNFWATWCPACNEEIPALKKIFNEYKEKISIFAIDAGESREKVSSFIRKKSIDYPVLLDEDKSVTSLYSVRGIPTVIVIDINKKIQYYGYSLDEARDIVKTLMK